MHYVDLFREKAHFPFLKLPAEIRVMIYKLAFVSDRWIMVIDMDFLEFEDLEESGPPLRRNTYRMDASIAGYISETSRQEYRVPRTSVDGVLLPVGLVRTRSRVRLCCPFADKSIQKLSRSSTA